MVVSAPFRATAADTHDDEGFRLVTSAATLKAHVGQEASVWLPGRSFASEMSVLVEGHRVTLTRDGHGDVLTFDHGDALFMTSRIFLNGRQVGWLRLMTDAPESGFFYPMDNVREVQRFPDVATGLVMLGSTFVI